MSEKRGIHWGNPVIMLIGLTALATALTIGLALLGYETGAAIIGTATFFLWLSLIVVTTAVVVSWWSATLMERGAQIALTAQVSDDKRDIAQIRAVGDLAKILWHQTQPERLALPLPSQQADKWLPDVTGFDVPDVEGDVYEP